MEIIAIKNLNLHEIAHLVALSSKEGFRFLNRLVNDWKAGTNQFNKPNEALYIIKIKEQIVGIGGINQCPYTKQEQVGRIRRVYVHPDHRRKGVARQLVKTIINNHRMGYTKITLRTPTKQASQFYESIGFDRIEDSDTHTHELTFK